MQRVDEASWSSIYGQEKLVIQTLMVVTILVVLVLSACLTLSRGLILGLWISAGFTATQQARLSGGVFHYRGAAENPRA
jgi:MFS superfamily sulfate permease-like transporter